MTLDSTSKCGAAEYAGHVAGPNFLEIETRLAALEAAVSLLNVYRVVAVDAVLTIADHIVKVTAAGVTITLPTAVGNTGREFMIDNASAGDVTVVGNGAETIEDEATQTLLPNSGMYVYSDGVGWRIC